MMSLEEKRSSLQRELDHVQQQLAQLHGGLFTGAPVTPGARVVSSAPAKPGRRKRIQRGMLSETIIAALAAAGQAGLRVRDLAAQIGTKAPNIHSWLQSTAKKHPGISKIASGLYRFTPGAASAAAPKTKAKGGKKGKGGKRGALSANIMAVLEKAGADGISVKELAEKAGSHYQNVSIWFATTGKKNGKISKVGPARYKLAA